MCANMLAEALALAHAAGDRIGQRHADQEGERRLDHVVQDQPGPLHVRLVIRQDIARSRLSGIRARDRGEAAAPRPSSAASRGRDTRRRRCCALAACSGGQASRLPDGGGSGMVIEWRSAACNLRSLSQHPAREPEIDRKACTVAHPAVLRVLGIRGNAREDIQEVR